MELFTELCRRFPAAEIQALERGRSLLLLPGTADVEPVLEELGLYPLQRREISRVRFAAYGDGTQTVYLTVAEAEVRLVWEPGQTLPAADSGPSVTTPLLTQLHLRYFAYDCGMGYVIRLWDGRFVLIDGSMAEAGEAEHLLELLERQNVLPGVPRVAAWFITHAHDDHYQLFTDVMTRFPHRLKVERLLRNFPLPGKSGRFSSTCPAFLAAEESVPGMAQIMPHTGQRYEFGGVRFDILYTSDDLCPEFNGNLNETSLVMRMETAGRRVLWLADASALACGILCRRYDRETLGCDLLQVGHHGYWGSSPMLDRLADPEALLWPVPESRLEEARRMDCNAFLVTSPRIRRTYAAGVEEVTLDLTEPLPDTDPYGAYRNCRAGETLYRVACTVTAPERLPVGCLIAGGVDYGPASLTLDGRAVTLSAGDRRAVCTLIPAGVTEHAPSFTLRLRGRGGAFCGETGLIWNTASPMQWNPEAVLPLPVRPGEEFDLTLTADVRKGYALLRQAGAPLRQLPYAPASRRGIYLVLWSSEVCLEEITLMQG